MKKNNKINLKSQRGAATALVVFTVLMFITILIGVYGVIVARSQAQLKSDAHIQDIYGADVARANEIYEEQVLKALDREAPTVTITMENSTDYIFAVKSVVTIADNKELDYTKCKYIYTNTDTPLGDNISSYTEGNITGETTTVEKPKAAGTYYLHVLATDTSGNTTEGISDTAVTIADIQNYSYTGAAQEVNLMAGNYKFECWGASGAEDVQLGGYTSGNIQLNENKSLYVYIGQNGQTSSGGFNGGGAGRNADTLGYRYGGGATDIRITSGTWNNFDSLKSRVMVAGGGGGVGTVSYPTSRYTYGASGGLTGYTFIDANYTAYTSGGGTQTAGGTVNNYSSSYTLGTNGAFGVGGIGGGASTGGSGGGGGGYYGGAGGARLSSGSWGGRRRFIIYLRTRWLQCYCTKLNFK